ncbi:hypothetical protein L226DRAFT_532409 [Lentinus tigrinus ALCF2SS1-7]|uniref:DUF6534 domain-containing protein n=1 Tax=Lentinus tigrinus ALCF2SS1-6 TaxID=1328759 RepID=A0A5C2SH83_9APHY|nr:hypothetical protein L227DRAFT_431103 [Lentinus tigrinus ALCF2SS1-6]RPD77634.1 hypothetical protein L226DRAFT_532409 [Lentinus tigrinus ALCF2SS1-7]
MSFAPVTYAGGAPPAELELGSSYGVMLLSVIITAMLYGFTVLQSLYYFEQFPKDSWLLKSSVVALWVLDTLTIVFDSHEVYFYLIVNYNNPPALQKEVWSSQAELLVTYTIVLIVQIFFLLRIHHLRPYMWYIPAVLGVIAVASYAMVVVIFFRVIHDTTWADTDRPSVTRPLTANWVLGMIVDIGITVILCWYLWTEKLAVRQKTNVMLNRIIVFMVNRGAIAAVVQILTLLTKFIWPQTLVMIAFHNALSKVYTNSMLATLNARVALRKIIMDTELDQTQPPNPSQFSGVAAFSAVRPSPVSSGRPVSKAPTMSNLKEDGHQIATLHFAPNPMYRPEYDAMYDAPPFESDIRSVTATDPDYGQQIQRPKTGMSNYTSYTTHTVRSGATHRTLGDEEAGSPQERYGKF